MFIRSFGVMRQRSLFEQKLHLFGKSRGPQSSCCSDLANFFTKDPCLQIKKQSFSTTYTISYSDTRVTTSFATTASKASAIRNLTQITEEMQKRMKQIEKELELVLGLDISSKFSGYTVLLGSTGEAIDCGLIETAHIIDEMDKCSHICKSVNIIKETAERIFKEKYTTEGQNKNRKIKWAIGVEDPLKFVAMINNVPPMKTLLLLYKINSIVQYQLALLFGERPLAVPFAKARSYFGLKVTNSTESIKDVVFHWVQERLPNYQWKLKRNGTLDETNYDITDSFIVARYVIKQYREQELMKHSDLIEAYKQTYLSRRAKQLAVCYLLQTPMKVSSHDISEATIKSP
jgi:hypothetical protein